MAKGLLDASQIPFIAMGEITALVASADPQPKPWVEIQVPGDREAEARDALGALLQPEEST